jgi:outer membrane lipoprotein-sorting protein
MNKMKTSFFILVALFSLSIAKAQTADDIIAKHIDAVGGKDKIAQVNSVYLESTASVMGNDAPAKTYILNGKAYKNEMDFGGQSFVTVVTDTGGWMVNPYAGATDPTPLPDDQFKASADQVNAIDPLSNYTVNGGKVELQGQEKVGEVNAWKLKYTSKYGKETTYYVDPATYYIIQSVTTNTAMGQEQTVTITYSDYNKTDFGVVLPNTMHIDAGQYAIDIKTQKVEINKDIDPKIFEMSK